MAQMTEGTTIARPFGRSVAHFGNLNAAEREVVAKAEKGEPAKFGDKVPATNDEKAKCTIHAGLIRFLALGGDDATAVHEKGVRIQGALIHGALDFEGCTLAGDLFLENCEFDSTLTLRDATTRTINLSGSKCRAIVADRLDAAGSVFLREGFSADGPVRLLAAKIGGTLDCGGGRFTGSDPKGNVLACDGIETRGAVHLGRGFYASGIVRMVGAKIGIDVSCERGTFGASDASKSQTAIDLSRAVIAGTLWLTGQQGELATFHGGVKLAAAKVGRIVDRVRASKAPRAPNALSAEASASPAFLSLDGLTYDRFGEPTDLSAAARIAFLDLQSLKDVDAAFKPQPWEQLIKILREMGHSEEARNVAIEKQIRLRKAGKIAGPPVWHILYGWLSRYGYRPYLLILWAFGIAVTCAVLFEIGARYGVMVPTDRRILDDVKYQECRPERGGNWTRCNALIGRYPAFEPVVYSFDLILPVIATQQSKDWTVAMLLPCAKVGCFGFCSCSLQPDMTATKHGYSVAGLSLWLVARAENLIGWIFGLMFVAIVSGLVKKD